MLCFWSNNEMASREKENSKGIVNLHMHSYHKLVYIGNNGHIIQTTLSEFNTLTYLKSEKHRTRCVAEILWEK